MYDQTPTEIVDFSAYRDHNRLLLIFTSSEADENYLQETGDLEDREQGFERRDLMLLRFVESLNPEATAAARQRFNLQPNTFYLVLIGKDGTVKMQTHNYTPVADIFALIDQMPRRKEEIRRENEG